jgi:hypothetical protein
MLQGASTVSTRIYMCRVDPLGKNRRDLAQPPSGPRPAAPTTFVVSLYGQSVRNQGNVRQV